MEVKEVKINEVHIVKGIDITLTVTEAVDLAGALGALNSPHDGSGPTTNILFNKLKDALPPGTYRSARISPGEIRPRWI